MVISKIETPQEYVAHLKTNPKELQSIFDDLLISVTSFFREPQTVHMLIEKVFPTLLEKKQNNQPAEFGFQAAPQVKKHIQLQYKLKNT